MDALRSLAPYLADALVLLGITVMTVGVYGIIRMPDVYTKLHAASKAVFLGAISLALASIATGDMDIILRVLLISGVLLITTPISSHVIAHAAAIEQERMQTPGAIDESFYHLNEPTDISGTQAWRGWREVWRTRHHRQQPADDSGIREAKPK